MRSRRTVTLLAAVGILLTGTMASLAQTFVPLRMSAQNAPALSARVIYLDATGQPQALADGALQVAENGTSVTSTIACTPASQGRNVSLLVGIDASASTATGSPSAMDLMKNAARSMSALLTSTGDEIGLLTIDAQANLLYGLSTDKTTYGTVVDNVRTSTGIQLTTGLLAQPMGGLIHLQNARNARTMVLLTDGAPSFDVISALGTARTFGIRVYVIGMRSALTEDLRRLADSTGGAWAENVTTNADAIAWSRAFIADAKGLPGCNVSWSSTERCGGVRNVTFTLGTTTRTLEYSAPDASIPRLYTSTLGVDFGQPTGGSKVTRVVTLSAQTYDIVVLGWTFSSPAFNVVSGPALPLTIPAGSSSNFIVEYTAASTDGAYGTWTLQSTSCEPTVISLRGGSPLRGDVLTLLTPNGGESVLAGRNMSITWTNVLPQDPVRIELSTNSGNSWRPIAEAATGLEYAWQVGPETSTKARIRVSRTMINENNITILRGHVRPVYASVFTADNAHVITGGHDGTVRMWNSSTGAQERIVGVHLNWVWGLAVMPGTTYVASASFDGSVRVWDYMTGDRVATIPLESQGYSLAFSPDGKHLYIGTARTLQVYSTASWTSEFSKVVDAGPVYALSLSADGTKLAVAEGTQTTVRNAANLELTATCASLGRTGKIYAVAISPDGQRVASGGTDFVLSSFSAADGSFIASAESVIGSILALQFAPNGSSLVSAGGDGTAKIYNPTTLALQSSLAGHQGILYGARFSSDGRRLVTASTDQTARVWQLEGIGTVVDVSNADFRILGGTASASTIDFGSVAFGTGADKIATAITVQGGSPLVILGASVVGGDTRDFDLCTAELPDSISAGQPLQLDVSFVPTQVGPRSADLDVITGTGVVRVRLTGTGSLPLLEGPTVIDFGRRIANQAIVDTNIVIRVPSAISGSVAVNTTTLVGPQSNQFRVINGGGSFTLQPGQSRTITVRFEPTEFGRYACELQCQTTSGQPLRVRLYGEGSGDGRISVSPTVLFSTNPCNTSVPSQIIKVNNYGQASMQIFSIGVEGNDASEFAVTPPSALPIRVEPGETIELGVAFTPTKNGVKDARVIVSSSAINAPNGRSVTQVSARRDSVGFELSRTVVDFANIREDQEVIERILLLNTGTVALRWPRQSVTIGRFRIESITPEVTQPGERSNLTVRFLGGTAGTTYQESYTFTDSVCGTSEQLLLRASIKSYIGATMRVGSVQTRIGQQVGVPVYVSNKVNFDRTTVTSINAILRTNGTILTPTGSTPSGTFEADGTRLIPVTIPIPQTDSLATTLQFTTSWGNDTVGIIDIDSLILTDTLEITTVAGRVSLTDICYQGGPRLFRNTDLATGIQIAPMPVRSTTTVYVSTIEPGHTRVDVLDIAGRTITTLVDRKLPPGTWFVPLDVSIIPNGTYYVVLTTPSQRIVERMEVVR